MRLSTLKQKQAKGGRFIFLHNSPKQHALCVFTNWQESRQDAALSETVRSCPAQERRPTNQRRTLSAKHAHGDRHRKRRGGFNLYGVLVKKQVSPFSCRPNGVVPEVCKSN